MEETFIVDGYNVIYSMYPKTKDLESAREELIKLSKLYSNKRVIIVFDGKGGISSNHHKDVVFTKGESADDYIKRLVRNSKHPNNITVVTKDKNIVSYVKPIGAKTMPPHEFFQGPKNFRKRRETMAFTHLEKGVLTPRQVKDINSELVKLWDIED